MNKTELLNRCAGGDEETRLILARALDKLETAERRGVPAHTPFLSPAQRVAVEGLINASGHPRHLFTGGYEGAERTICVFLPDWLEEEDWPAGEHPLAALQLTAPAGAKLTHRDWLGSILGLGLTREKLGDLLVADNQCQAIVLSETAEIVRSQLDKVGRYPVKAAPLALEELTVPERTVKLIRDTFATLRLDAVAASAFSLPRSKAAALITSGRVSLNHVECTKPDRLVNEGDIITCRGSGKCVVKCINGQSKKGRIMAELERYV
ncbi:MAG: RNA-binding protein [Oscillospiraceae bacterium]